jgi:hypothetical protein
LANLAINPKKSQSKSLTGFEKKSELASALEDGYDTLGSGSKHYALLERWFGSRLAHDVLFLWGDYELN